MKKKRILSILIALLIFVVIYLKIDFARLENVVSSSNILLIAISFVVVVPLALLSAWRLKLLVPGNLFSLSDSLKFTLAAGVLNMVLPSKAGDIAKSHFISKDKNISLSMAVSLTIFERALDILSLLIWCSIGLLLNVGRGEGLVLLTYVVLACTVFLITLISWPRMVEPFFYFLSRLAPKKILSTIEELKPSWRQMHMFFWRSKAHIAGIFLISMLSWFLSMFQIWLFVISLNGSLPLMSCLGLAPLAILVGLLPVTIAGIGTRDAAFIILFRNFVDPSISAIVGLLCTIRYAVYAIAGLPFIINMRPFVTTHQKLGQVISVEHQSI